MSGIKTGALAVLLLLTASARSAAEHTATAQFVVIVNPANAVRGVDRKFLSDAFLKKSTRWEDGEVILPVDLDSEAAARRTFSREVLLRSVSAVKSYWQQSIFSGHDVPPPELDTDAEVINYVVKHRGALGYVSAAADVSNVKTLTVR